MKLLLITSSFPQNGLISGVFIPDTIRALNRLGVSVHVLTQNCYGSEALTNELWPGCVVTYFGWAGGSPSDFDNETKIGDDLCASISNKSCFCREKYLP
jgi:hypothetical protein